MNDTGHVSTIPDSYQKHRWLQSTGHYHVGFKCQPVSIQGHASTFTSMLFWLLRNKALYLLVTGLWLSFSSGPLLAQHTPDEPHIQEFPPGVILGNPQAIRDRLNQQNEAYRSPDIEGRLEPTRVEAIVTLRPPDDTDANDISARLNRISEVIIALENTGSRLVSNLDPFPILVMELTIEGLNVLETLDAVGGLNVNRTVQKLVESAKAYTSADDMIGHGITGGGLRSGTIQPWTVAVIDDGIRRSHTVFAGKNITELCFHQSCVTAEGPGAASHHQGDSHGTHVASIAVGGVHAQIGVVGVAPEADLIAANVFETNGQARTSAILAALSRVLQLHIAGTHRVASVNLSLGTARTWPVWDRRTCDRDNPGYRTAFDQLRAAGIWVIAASGNDGDLTGASSPACVTGAIDVGSVDTSWAPPTPDSDGTVEAQISSFSNLARYYAPGRGIRAAGVSSDQELGISTGTSMAAPHVAGMVAALSDCPQLNHHSLQSYYDFMSLLHGSHQLVDNRWGEDHAAWLINMRKYADQIYKQTYLRNNPEAEDGLNNSFFNEAEQLVTEAATYHVPFQQSLQGTSACKTRETHETDGNESLSNDGGSSWYRFTAPDRGIFSLTTCGVHTEGSTKINLYTGNTLDSLVHHPASVWDPSEKTSTSPGTIQRYTSWYRNSAGQNRQCAELNPRIHHKMESGETIHIQVSATDNDNLNQGRFSLDTKFFRNPAATTDGVVQQWFDGTNYSYRVHGASHALGHTYQKDAFELFTEFQDGMAPIHRINFNDNNIVAAPHYGDLWQLAPGGEYAGILGYAYVDAQEGTVPLFAYSKRPQNPWGGQHNLFLTINPGAVPPAGYSSHGHCYARDGGRCIVGHVKPIDITPELESPVDAEVESPVTFVWSNHNAAQGYRLWIRNSAGKVVLNQLFDRDQLDCASGATHCSYEYSETLPAGATLWYVQASDSSNVGAWSNRGDFSVIGNGSQICEPPNDVSLDDGAALSLQSHSISWGGSACEYWVYAGTRAGDKSYADSGSMSDATNFSFSGYPQDGSEVVITLYYRPLSGGSWQSVVRRAQAPNAQSCTQPTGISPVEGTTLSSGNATISWDNTNCEYWLYAGPTERSRAYSDSLSMGNLTSHSLSGYPEDGTDVVVTLYYRPLSGGSWAALTLNYVAPLGEERECSEPDGISPISYSLLSASSQLLTWNRSDCDYWVYAGPTAGSSEYSDSGNLGNQNSYWLSGYPEGNAYFTVTLFYRPLSGGSWDSKVLTYTAPPEEAECTEPLRLSGNSLLAVGSELLEWEFTNCEYWIYAGATPGANEFADSGNLGSTTAYLLEGYPTNISYIYVTLFYRPPSERAWKRRVIQYCGPSNTQDCD